MEIPARHPRKGDCVIRKQTLDLVRMRVVVDYPHLGLSGRPESLDELVDRHTGKPICLESPTPPLPRPIPRDAKPAWQAARQTLLALRLGQSTAESVRDLSVGLSEVEEACRWAIGRAGTGQVSFLLFESPYGMGKSHALAHLRLRARQANMATGTVVLDGVNISLCLPMSLVAALAHTIEFPEGATADGLPQRLAGLVRTGATERLSLNGCELLYSVLRKVEPKTSDDPDVWDVVEDFLSLEVSAGVVRSQLGLVVPALKTRRDDRPMRCVQLMREWAQACVVTGARNGLVILLDEADVDYSQSGRTIPEREQRTALLRSFHQLVEMGPCYSRGYGRLVIALAITPGASEPDPVKELQNEFGDHLRAVRLRELNMEELRHLGHRICDLYCAGYELPDTEKIQMETTLSDCLSGMSHASEGRNPRKFIRLLLEKLDIAYA